MKPHFALPLGLLLAPLAAHAETVEVVPSGKTVRFKMAEIDAVAATQNKDYHAAAMPTLFFIRRHVGTATR
jgi:hypothetical protein